ncbi:hypothetical protein PINS_up006010 [Pythium insidiosum]|nr:hypothetical protein PINS_up006010 [Pythium insidiosum]
MLPRRQMPPSRVRPTHTVAGISTRRAVLGALAFIFVFAVYVNFRFLSSSATGGDASSRKKTSFVHDAAAAKASTAFRDSARDSTKLSDQLAFETRQVKHIVFTSGCSEIEVLRAEVLSHSARAKGYEHDMTHAMYGCGVPEYEAILRRKNPSSRVESVGFPAVQAQETRFGAGWLNTTIHFEVLQQWFKQELNRNRLKDDDFVMLAESDAIFTKNVDVWNLFREVEDIADPRWFGQDAEWYEPHSPPLSKEELLRVLPSDTTALSNNDWREFAATGPYVVEVALLKEVLPTIVEIWQKLSPKKRYLAVPLAAAHHEIPIGISGVLSIHRYPSRYENWDFADDVRGNPCNESVGADIDLESYPITIRPQNFTLPPWIDGREWNFFDTQLPSQFLDCDAWLLREPSGYLWHLASYTNGYERVPTILRRRHTISVCLALHAYNDAALAYKSHFCPTGFNSNKRITMELGRPAWGSAIALANKNDVVDRTEARRVISGEYTVVRGGVERLSKPPAGHLDSSDIHFVYITDCAVQSQWQSDVLAHSFSRASQRGQLTRIVSDCKDDSSRAFVLEQHHDNARVYPHLKVFFSDSKEQALQQWLTSSSVPVRESIIVLLSVDLVFLRALSVNSGHRVTRASKVDSQNYATDTEVIEGLRQYKRFFVYEGSKEPSKVSDQVTARVAIAQRSTKTMTEALSLDSSSSPVYTVCADCRGKLSSPNARERVYITAPFVMARDDLAAAAKDIGAMASKLATARVADADAAAVGLSAAKADIQFTAFDNLAFSATRSDDFTGFLDLLKDRNPCEPSSPLVPGEAPLWLSLGERFEARESESSTSTWRFAAALVPDNLFACDAWLLAEPPASLWTAAKASRNLERMRQAYGVCTSIKLVNEAVVAQRRARCASGFNENRRLRLVDPRPQAMLEVGGVHEAWAAAAQ